MHKFIRFGVDRIILDTVKRFYNGEINSLELISELHYIKTILEEGKYYDA